MVSSMRVLLKTKEEVLEITDGATGESGKWFPAECYKSAVISADDPDGADGGFSSTPTSITQPITTLPTPSWHLSRTKS